jgi:hypothetical protein
VGPAARGSPAPCAAGRHGGTERRGRAFHACCALPRRCPRHARLLRRLTRPGAGPRGAGGRRGTAPGPAQPGSEPRADSAE